jgi:hypothetical protein
MKTEVRLVSDGANPKAVEPDRLSDPACHPSQDVTVAGNAELAQPADPARDLLALGIGFVEVVICGAENDAGDARQPRDVAFHRDLGAEITADATSSPSPRIRGRH